jgi:predicted dehydrogenase
MSQQITRRDVVKAGAVLGAGALVAPAFASRAARTGSDTIRVGVIGCGGRGTGAAVNALEADEGTRVVALADLFPDRLAGSLARLTQQGEERFKGRVEIPEERRFTGFDAYRKLLALDDVDMVILATPPGFRPLHFQAAVNAGKHVFMEKPVAVDPAGVRTVIESARIADEKSLSVVSGTQRRHQDNYLELMRRIEDGAIGEVVSARCYWNQGGLWVHERAPEYTDMEWQCRNWLYFAWLSGDHICEQHIHNIDVINWAKGGPPASAMGMGGRQVRTDDKYGNIFDHFAIDYEYPDGSTLLSMCRQIDGCAGKVQEDIIGTKGSAMARPGLSVIKGANAWRIRGEQNPYVTEHVDLIASIRGRTSRLNEGKRVAESTLTAVMGRMSAYTGKAITWEEAMNSQLDLSPAEYAFTALETDPVPTPGRTPLT